MLHDSKKLDDSKNATWTSNRTKPDFVMLFGPQFSSLCAALFQFSIEIKFLSENCAPLRNKII